MQIVKMKQPNTFALAGLSFSALKTLKDACKLYGTQGSALAKQIAEELEQRMNEVEV